MGSSRYPAELNSELMSPELAYNPAMKPPTSNGRTKKMKIKVLKNDGTAGRIIELADGQKRIFRSAQRSERNAASPETQEETKQVTPGLAGLKALGGIRKLQSNGIMGSFGSINGLG